MDQEHPKTQDGIIDLGDSYHQERTGWVWMKEVCRLKKVYLRRSSSEGLNQTVPPPHVVKMTQAHREKHKLESGTNTGSSGH